MNMVVHPSQYYVGIKHEKTFISNKPFFLEIVVTDIGTRRIFSACFFVGFSVYLFVDGTLIPDVTVTIISKTVNPVTTSTATIFSEKSHPVKYQMPVPAYGNDSTIFSIEASVVDPKGKNAENAEKIFL